MDKEVHAEMEVAVTEVLVQLDTFPILPVDSPDRIVILFGTVRVTPSLIN